MANKPQTIEEAKHDPHYWIRKAAYEADQSYQEAESDPDWLIRLWAFNRTKNWEKALKDPEYWVVRHAKKIILGIIKKPF